MGSCPCRGVVHKDCDVLILRSVAGQSLAGGKNGEGKETETEPGLPPPEGHLC